MVELGRIEEQARHRVETMRKVFAESEVVGYQSIIRGIRSQLPDPDDAHVVAAAIRSGAERIVTFNLADFPPPLLAEHGVEVRHPDIFLCELVDIYSTDFLSLLRYQAESQRQPAVTFEQLLAKLEKDTPKFVAQVRQALRTEVGQAPDAQTEEDWPAANVVDLENRRRRAAPKSRN